MIYSQDHNFLLISNQKVAATSLEMELSKILPLNAIVTPLFPVRPDHNPRNHKDIFYKHMGYSEIKQFLWIMSTDKVAGDSLFRNSVRWRSGSPPNIYFRSFASDY